jgi:hypothetical protein
VLVRCLVACPGSATGPNSQTQPLAWLEQSRRWSPCRGLRHRALSGRKVRTAGVARGAILPKDFAWPPLKGYMLLCYVFMQSKLGLLRLERLSTARGEKRAY